MQLEEETPSNTGAEFKRCLGFIIIIITIIMDIVLQCCSSAPYHSSLGE